MYAIMNAVRPVYLLLVVYKSAVCILIIIWKRLANMYPIGTISINRPRNPNNAIFDHTNLVAKKMYKGIPRKNAP